MLFHSPKGPRTLELALLNYHPLLWPAILWSLSWRYVLKDICLLIVNSYKWVTSDKVISWLCEFVDFNYLWLFQLLIYFDNFPGSGNRILKLMKQLVIINWYLTVSFLHCNLLNFKPRYPAVNFPYFNSLRSLKLFLNALIF